MVVVGAVVALLGLHFVALCCIRFTGGFELIDAVRSVSIQPGWMTLQRMPQSA